MTISQNRFYNNPQIGAAFESIAGIFAPPSAQDTAAFARAKADREAAAREAEAFEAMTAAGADPAAVDRYGVAIGRFNPTQSYRALEMGDATNRRGQNIDASTSRANTAATVAGGIEQQKLSSLAGMFGPLSEGQIRPSVPGDIASLYGAAGEIWQAEGRAKPLSETEVRGAERQRLTQSGKLTDQNLLDVIMGADTPVEAIGASGTPVFMAPGAAVRTGAQPAPSKPLVSINTGEAPDGDLRKKLDESEGKRLSDLQAAAVTSAGLQQDLDLMSRLIDEAPQGPLVGRLAAAFPGFSDAGAAFQSIVERAAPGLRVEGSGATSDIEFKGMLNSLPQLRNRPEANRLIAEMMKAKADINIRRGELVTAYQTGDLDASQMRRRLAELNRQSVLSPALRQMIDAAGSGAEPLTPPSAPASASTGAPTPGTIVDGFRFKGGDPAEPSNWEAL